MDTNQKSPHFGYMMYAIGFFCLLNVLAIQKDTKKVDSKELPPFSTAYVGIQVSVQFHSSF